MSDHQESRTPERANAADTSTRRELLKRLGAASAALPLSAMPAAAQQTIAPEEAPDLCEDADALDRTAALIDRAAIDPAFRAQIKAQPLQTLNQMGLGLSEDAAAVFEMIRDNSSDPDMLLKAMLGQEFPPMNRSDEDVAHAAALPLVAVGVRVATRPATRPAVRVATRVAVKVRVASRPTVVNIAPEQYGKAMFKSLTGRNIVTVTPVEPVDPIDPGNPIDTTVPIDDVIRQPVEGIRNPGHGISQNRRREP